MMPIKELPRATSRLVSSSQVLTTPASLVKELLDNALDAKATSIDISIAANTLDKIEVRDNGHGIAPEDLKAIGKRGYTSKLRNFDELKTLGGLTLGFRGEALASALELGDVSITTRIDGEAVGTVIKLKANGGVESQTSISHPVGTTVCVTNFFSKLPVRRQTALKDARKIMSRIKEMLQSYALARLNVRLTFKVFKVGKSNWSFAPRANGCIREVASQIIGRETAAQCMEMISTLLSPSRVYAGASGLGDDTSANLNDSKSPEMPPQSGFVIQALLLKPDADLTKISGGQYVSIDSRPVSFARGTPKKIVSMYKSIISAILVDDVPGKVKSPFICMNIVCPAGSYDPNVEPAKDDVLFEDEKALLSLVENWFRGVYGDRMVATSASNKTLTNQDEARDTAHSTNPVETLIINGDIFSSIKPGIEISKASVLIHGDGSAVNNSVLGESPDRSITGRMSLHTSPGTPNVLPAVDQPRAGFDMSEDYPEELEFDEVEQTSACYQLTAEDTRIKHTSRTFTSLNPWVIAKHNAHVIKEKTRESTLADPVGESTSKRPPSTPFILPTPRGSSMPRPSSGYCNLGPLERCSYENISVSDNSQSSIEGWLQQNQGISRENSTHLCDVLLPSPGSSDPVRAFAEVGNVIMDRDVSSCMLRSPLATQAHLAPRVPRNVNKHFVSPLRDTYLAFPLATEMRVKSLPSRRPQSNAGVDMILDEGEDDRVHGNERRSEVHEALDFERRKEAATRKLRDELRRSQSGAEVPSNVDFNTRPSPHKSRYHAAMAALDSNPNCSSSERANDEIPIESCLPDDDPRAYLMRRRKSIVACSEKPSVGRKLKRVKTMFLPLETTPDMAQLHGLCQVVSTNISFVRKALLTLARNDQYTKSGNQSRGLVMSTTDIQAVEMQLGTLMKSWVQIKTGEEIDIVPDLGALQGRSTFGA
jgi:DNA mismatch repair protein MutL